MEKHVDIAAIGNDDSILLFNSIGIRTFSIKNSSEIEKTIFQLANQKCKIIYVTEEIYTQIPETIERFKNSPFPIILPIPTSEGSKEVGLQKIRDNVEKAIGINIF